MQLFVHFRSLVNTDSDVDESNNGQIAVATSMCIFYVWNITYFVIYEREQACHSLSFNFSRKIIVRNISRSNMFKGLGLRIMLVYIFNIAMQIIH